MDNSIDKKIWYDNIRIRHIKKEVVKMNRIFIIETIQLSPLYPLMNDQEIAFLIQQIEDELVLFSPSLKEEIYPQ